MAARDWVWDQGWMDYYLKYSDLEVCKKMFCFVFGFTTTYKFLVGFWCLSLYVRKTRIPVVAFKDEGTMPLPYLYIRIMFLIKISSFIS